MPSGNRSWVNGICLDFLNTVLTHCLGWIVSTTSELISRYSSFSVNFALAHEHTGLPRLRFTSNSKTYMEERLQGDWLLTRCGETQGAALFPLWAHWSLHRDWVGVKNTHWSSVFQWFFSSIYLWHSPLLPHLMFFLIHTYACFFGTLHIPLPYLLSVIS